MFWVGHHAQFHFVRYVDHTLLWINLDLPVRHHVGPVFHRPPRRPPPSAPALLALRHQADAARRPAWLLQVAYLRRHPELAHPSLTRGVARRIIGRPALFATIPLLSMAAVLYNTRLGAVPLLPACSRSFPARTRRSRPLVPTTTDRTPPCHEENPDPRRQRLHRPPSVPADHRRHRLGNLRDGHAGGSHRRPAAGEALSLLRRRHHDQPGMDRVPRQEVRRRAAAGCHRHAGNLCARAAAGVRARLRGQPADRPRVRALRQADRLSVDLRGVRDVRRRANSIPRPPTWCWGRSTSRAGSIRAPSS